MKFFPFAALLALVCFANSCSHEAECEDNASTVVVENEEESGYDSTLAKSLGADEYGMHAYVIAFLKEGPNRNQSEEEAANLQRAHMDNIQRMAAEGKLVTAGPFLDEGTLKGIYIFNVETVEEAQKLTETDPAIKAGRLIMELHPWYGPASMQQIIELQKKVTKTEF